mmetsp:Transcript_91360/g.284726  ORF Transcript_91360/g.284726 Transcript_91360/m.284726 type:complete len:309 (-) Transcript_91360:25-951(-)
MCTSVRAYMDARAPASDAASRLELAQVPHLAERPLGTSAALRAALVVQDVHLLAHEDPLVRVALGVDVDDDGGLLLDRLLDVRRQLVDLALLVGVLDLVPDGAPRLVPPRHREGRLRHVADDRVHLLAQLHHLHHAQVAEQRVLPRGAKLRGHVPLVDLRPEIEGLGDGVGRRRQHPARHWRDADLVRDGKAPVQFLALLRDVAPLAGLGAVGLVCVVLDVDAIVVVHPREERCAELVVRKAHRERRKVCKLVGLRRVAKLEALPAEDPLGGVHLLPVEALARVCRGARQCSEGEPQTHHRGCGRGEE